MREGVALRAQVKQVRHYLHPYREDRRSAVYDAAAFRGLRVPLFRPRRRIPGSVWAVTMVRDEIDVLDRTLNHFLGQGVERVLVADNGSQDGTLERLQERSAADPRIHAVVDRDGQFFQAAKMTRLAQVAALAGADWVVPFDADELWFAPGMTLADFFAGSDANQVFAKSFNAVPTGDVASGHHMISSEPSGFPKVAFRAHPFARLEFGNHEVHRVGARETGLYIAHLAYRGREHLRRKLVHGASAISSTGVRDDICYHWRWGAALSEADLEDVWANITAGRPDPRIDWGGLSDPFEAVLASWRQWEGPRVQVPSTPEP